MPQGLQVFDNTGTLVIDTSTLVLREYVSQVVSSSANGSVTIAPPANTTVFATAKLETADPNAKIPELDLQPTKIDYKFTPGGNTYNTTVKLQAF